MCPCFYGLSINSTPKQPVVLVNNLICTHITSLFIAIILLSASTIPGEKAHLQVQWRVCMWVRNLSPAESTVTCSAGSNLCSGGGDTVAHAEMASFLSTNPGVLPHTSSPRWQFHPRHDLSGPQAADKGAPARAPRQRMD